MSELQTEPLNSDTISMVPVSYDWAEGYPEKWDIILPDPDKWPLGDCRAYLDEVGADMPEPDPWTMDRADLVAALEGIGIACYDEESNDTLAEAYAESMESGDLDGADEWREAAREALEDNRHDFEPMMNYYYPLPDRDSFNGEDANKIQDMPLVLVEFEDENCALALTGGGMDLSWEICEAFIRLGYRPPLHFCDLPAMAGRGESEHDRAIIEACKESARIAIRWAEGTLSSLDRL